MRHLRIIKQPTYRETESLNKYLKEVSKIDLLTSQDEVDLAYKIRQGDDNALNKLVRSNLRFVISVAKQYQNQGLSLSDLISEGNVGLIKAAKRFDETRGFKFISYAVWWIRQSIIMALAEQANIVRFPNNKIDMMNKINKMYAELEQEFQRAPTEEELADELGMNSSEISTMINNAMNHISMDAPFSDDSDNNLYDILLNHNSQNPEKKLIKESLQVEIENVLSTLRESDAEIIKMYFGLSGRPQHTLLEIGEKLNITKERVRQIKTKLIEIMKERSATLRQYL